MLTEKERIPLNYNENIRKKNMCLYPNLKENKYKHYEISESIENIIRLDEKLKTIRKLKENQISIMGMYNIFMIN
ncbi:hypothetical protein ONA24_01485 [Mycoplasmopsis cynos]|uniref:hypothetical protein n=1 Tax=Mycoplasmopsis cynos TaxID=171284 RepID=UPI0024C9422F|nr:hypothetical protein [Mycoplasmopsis cynos]WAM09980.1 hypothetical protein ONA24_01485 [Mycoplasmopsis cynos]